MLDRAWAFAFRNLATLFLTFALVATPLHVTYSYAFRHVIAVRELHADIGRFPEFREVRSVGRTDLTAARIGFLALIVVEIALLPFAFGAARRIREVEREDGIPEVLDAWRAARSGAGAFIATLRSSLGPLLLATAVGLLIGWLITRIGMIVTEPLGPDQTFAGAALVSAAAHSLGAVFWLSATVIIAEGPQTPAKRSSSGKSVGTRDSTSV